MVGRSSIHENEASSGFELRFSRRVMVLNKYNCTCLVSFRDLVPVRPFVISSSFCFVTSFEDEFKTGGFRLHQRRRLTVLPMLATRFAFSNAAFVSWWDVGLLFRVA